MCFKVSAFQEILAPKNKTINWDDADAGNETYILQITELTENSLKWSTEISGEGTLTETFER